MKANKTLLQTAKILFAIFLCLSSTTTLKAQPATFPGIDPNAVMFDDFESGSISNWTARPGARGEKMSIELASAELGDPVRFGNYAMKVNIDFTDAQPNQTLMAQVSPAVRTIPGNESGRKRIGMWVYATPEVQGVWLRVATIAPGATTRSNPVDLSTAIDWIGWKYVQGDLPAGHEFHPDGIRFLVTGNFENYHVNGFVVIDDIRITNQDFQEDLTPPTIFSLFVNGLPISDSQIFRSETSNISFLAIFRDLGNSSDINYESVRIIVNGQAFKQGDKGFNLISPAMSHIMTDRSTALLSNLHLANGTHTIEVQVEDNFGNIATETAMIVVYNPRNRMPTITAEIAEKAQVGNPFEIKINTDNPRDVRELNFAIQMNNIGSVDEIGGVEFAPSAQGSTYNFNPRTGILEVNIKNNSRNRRGEILATIKIDISKNSNPTDVLRVSPVTARVETRHAASLLHLFDAFERNVSAAFDFNVQKRVVGAPGEVLVTDLNGNPVQGATVHVFNDVMTFPIASAVTNTNGIASNLNFTYMTHSVNIFVEKDGKYSYTRLIRTLHPLLTSAPTNIMSGTTIDPTTMKTFTWMQNPVTAEEPAIIKFAKKSDGEQNFRQVSGKTKMLEYTASVSSGVAKGNSVTLTGLTPGTTYIYQVGDGVNWSPTREFTTTTVTDKFSFSAFGDLQASQWAHMDRFLAAAATIEAIEPRPFFNLNVADIVDTDDRWDYMEFYGHLYNERPVFANIDRIFAFGNHEYMGTPNADNIKFMSGIPKMEIPAHLDAQFIGTGTYAVEYGNMLVIALDWEGAGDGTGLAAAQHIMTEQARWMDYVLSQHTDKTWRIVTLHYPIFPNASTQGSQEIYGEVFDKHNVNIVFCGHGHTFERVQAKNGVVTSPAGNRRTFEPTIDGGTLHFQLGGMKETNHNGRWIHAAIDGKKMTITVRDHNNDIVPEEGFVLYTK